MASNCEGSSLDSFLAISQSLPSEKLKELARKELGETEALKEECLQKLKDLIKDKGVACVSRDDFLLRFLRCKKFCVERSFQALKNYARFMVYINDRLLKLKPEMIKACIDRKITGFLPYRDAEGRLYFFARGGNWDEDVCSLKELNTIGHLFALYLAEQESSQISGFVYIYDGSNFPYSYLAYSIPYINVWRRLLLECLPVRHHALHIIFGSKMGELILSIVTPLVPKKLRERIKVYLRPEQISEHINPGILTQEFGGSLDPLNSGYLASTMIEFLQKLKAEQQFFFQ